MPLHKYFYLFALLLAVPVWSQVQEPSQPEQPAEQQAAATEPTPVTDERTPVPTPVDSTGMSLAFSSEQERSNYLQGGLSVGALYDDNVLNSNSDRVGDFSYSILPHIAWNQTTSRLHWTLDYAAGLVVNQRLSERNQQSHNLGANLQYRLSPHVDISVQDHFSISTGFFNQLLENPNTPDPGGVLQGPNSSLITPLAQNTSNVTSAQINYQFSAGNMIGASGSFYDSQYGNVAAGAGSLLDTRTETAEGFYSHRFSARNWTGVSYKFQQLSFDPSSDHTVTHSVLLFHTIYLQPKMQLSFFAGPEYSDQDSHIVTTVVLLPLVLIVSLPTTHQNWSVAGGATYAWQGQHTSVQASFVRRITDGGGLLGAVRSTNVSGTLRRQLTRLSALELAAGYATNDSLDVSSAGSSLKSASGSIGVERRLGSNFGLHLGYSRAYQEADGGAPTTNRADHNRGWVMISYDFSRPIGR